MAERTGRWARLRAWCRRQAWSLVVAAVGLVVLAGLGWLWSWAPNFYHDADKETATATTRAGILVVCAATIAAIGGALALIETRRANREADQRERYTKAIDQIGTTGKDKVDVRLGGIYALQRIAQDSDRDLPTIVEVLCAFVRGHERLPEEPSDYAVRALARHRPDVQAALTVIGRVHDPNRESHIDLGETDIETADLRSANLTGADLSLARLANAKLDDATLTGANLWHANLTGADLTGADLVDANLVDANLTNAELFAAKLANASLHGADLRHANLLHANLVGAKGLTDDQLEAALGDYGTQLPEGLARPGFWPTRPSASDDASADNGGDSG